MKTKSKIIFGVAAGLMVPASTIVAMTTSVKANNSEYGVIGNTEKNVISSGGVLNGYSGNVSVAEAVKEEIIKSFNFTTKTEEEFKKIQFPAYTVVTREFNEKLGVFLPEYSADSGVKIQVIKLSGWSHLSFLVSVNGQYINPFNVTIGNFNNNISKLDHIASIVERELVSNNFSKELFISGDKDGVRLTTIVNSNSRYTYPVKATDRVLKSLGFNPFSDLAKREMAAFNVDVYVSKYVGGGINISLRSNGIKKTYWGSEKWTKNWGNIHRGDTSFKNYSNGSYEFLYSPNFGDVANVK